MRKALVAGNWKMNKVSSELAGFFSDFGRFSNYDKSLVDVLIAPSSVMLKEALNLAGPLEVEVASQTCHEAEKGAFTGELSLPMLADIGLSWSLVGHSERRQYYGETNETVANKASACLERGFKPIICIGETLEERESGMMASALTRQLSAVVEKLPALGPVVFAYEPVWAIGTGKTASDEDADRAHAFIRSQIAEGYGADQAGQTRILYGGSVKPSNVSGLVSREHIDGALVGGASLQARDFADIVNEASKVAQV